MRLIALTKKQKNNRFLLSLVIIIAVLVIWFQVELRVADVKGEASFIKKLYYLAVRVLPVNPAIRLDVVPHHQEHALSCEVASLLMALRYKGVVVTETELINLLPISDPGQRSKSNTWGDPNVGFVGDINGTMPNTGYGVYEQPIYDLASKYRPAKIITDGTLADLIAEVTNGNPVIVWGVVVGRSKDISWSTPAGKMITAQLDEHARTLIGFTGDSAEPELMILLDPLYGEVRLPVKDFLKNWELMEKKAVVVY